jgi:hypothetical protein
MAIRNQHWYSLNEGIAYPVDESATSVDDAGLRMQNNIITDIHLRWPRGLGHYAFISSLTVTDTLVSVTFLVSYALDVAVLKPLAVISLPRPVVEGRQYPIDPQADGVGGWIVFGSGVSSETKYRARFSTPQQSFLTVRAARSYAPLAITGMRTLASVTPLEGIVRLHATEPLQIVGEDREIDGVLRTVAVIRLVDTAIETPRQDTTTAALTSVFQQFTGPCGSRPDSNTCAKPPIEFINAVGPDCDGLITLQIKGFALTAKIDQECGVLIDATVGLFDACLPPQLPSSAGLLPSQYDETNIVPPEPPIEPPVTPPASESLVIVGSLPYHEGFSDMSADMFTPIATSGRWLVTLTTGDTTRPTWMSQSLSESFSDNFVPQYALTSESQALRNITLWQGFDVQTVFRRVSIHTRMRPGSNGSKHNTGLVLNYRAHTTIAGRYEYYVVILNYDNQTLRLHRFDGLQLSGPIASVFAPGTRLDDWYRISATVLPGAATTDTRISVQLTGLTIPTVFAELGPIVVNNYRPSVGRVGFYADKSVSEFGYFYLEEVNA